MSTVTWIGQDDFEAWSGTDPADGQPFELANGVETDVSPELAAKIAADFPHLAVVDGKGPVAHAAAAPVDDGDSVVGTASASPLAQLLKLHRKQLDAKAAELGLDPAGFPDKRSVAAAIVATVEDEG